MKYLFKRRRSHQRHQPLFENRGNIVKTNLKAVKNLPQMFFFTDRKRIENIFEVVEYLPKNTAIIIREYDLEYSDRLEFSQKIAAIAKQNKQIVLVGKSWKLARQIRADGVHFSDLDSNIFLPQNCKKMILSFSCHHPKSLIRAKKLNADLVFFSPVFATKSHPNKKPVGIFALRNFAKRTSLKSNIPTFALGGINENNVKLLSGAFVSGFGGISNFLRNRS
ncbi:MAG: thiamine-phosphate pyrophosphorylase [Myxococcota bacterium]|jgi:thiamine-phosphate pyrophosphorylase